MKESTKIKRSNRNHEIYIRSKNNFMKRCINPGKCYRNSIKNYSEITYYLCSNYIRCPLDRRKALHERNCDN